jgi:photosystem II stability/assembly factor-like uncharacterized protein
VVLTADDAIAGWRLGAIHFLSPTVGVALTAAHVPCDVPVRGGVEVYLQEQPVFLAVTRDGGSHWLTEGSPVSVTGYGEQLVATSTSHAWAAVGAGRLMATTNSGATWTTETPRGRVLALALRRRTLWMLSCLGGSDISCVSVLVRKALPEGAWTISLPKLASSTGPALAVRAGRDILVNVPRLGVSGGTLAIFSDGGQRSTEVPDPTWMGQPCMPAGLTAAGNSWWLLCLGGAAAGSSTKALFHTTDAGNRWTIASRVTSLTAPLEPGAITREEPDALVAASPTRLWLAALNNLFVSNDGGARWSRVRCPNPQGTPASFDVLSPTHAWLLAAGQGLWRTTDGRHWTALGPVTFSP